MKTTCTLLISHFGRSAALYIGNDLAAQEHDMNYKRQVTFPMRAAQQNKVDSREIAVHFLSEEDEEIMHFVGGFPSKLDLLKTYYPRSTYRKSDKKCIQQLSY